MSDEQIVMLLEQIVMALESVQRKCSYAQREEDFLENETGQEKLDSICMKLIGVGEILKRIERFDQSIFQRYPDIPWKKIKGIRDFLSHHYFDLDAGVIFDICQHHIDPLLKAVKEILKDVQHRTR